MNVPNHKFLSVKIFALSHSVVMLQFENFISFSVTVTKT